MLGSTPPWAIVTPDSNLFSSTPFLNRHCQHRSRQARRTIVEMSALPDGELEVPGDDARLLVVPSGVPGELKDLGSGSGTHPLGVVALPGQREVSNHPDQKNRRQVPEKPVESVKGFICRNRRGYVPAS